jgi:hypothetical protein
MPLKRALAQEAPDASLAATPSNQISYQTNQTNQIKQIKYKNSEIYQIKPMA